MTNITLGEATKICDAATAMAQEMVIKIAVPVVDSGTNLVTKQKMDGP